MKRRDLIVAAGGLLLTSPARGTAPRRSKPQVDDILVYAFGDKAGKIIVPADILSDRVFAFPMSPSGTVRDGSLHNEVVLLRLDEAQMSEKTLKYSAGPLLAISAACTHTGCEVSGWESDTQQLVCPCHGSRYDVLEASKVVQGPATKPLALLPIEQHSNSLRVTGKFSRRVGATRKY
jgi:rieske iron-sulfur protein